MRKVVLFLAALCCTATYAVAGVNAGGTVTLHWNSAIAYTGDASFPNGGLTSCDASVVQAPPATTFPPPDAQRRIWFAYAAFPTGSSPRLKGVAFGVTYTNFVNPTG